MGVVARTHGLQRTGKFGYAQEQPPLASEVLLAGKMLPGSSLEGSVPKGDLGVSTEIRSPRYSLLAFQPPGFYCLRSNRSCLHSGFFLFFLSVRLGMDPKASPMLSTSCTSAPPSLSRSLSVSGSSHPLCLASVLSLKVMS